MARHTLWRHCIVAAPPSCLHRVLSQPALATIPIPTVSHAERVVWGAAWPGVLPLLQCVACPPAGCRCAPACQRPGGAPGSRALVPHAVGRGKSRCWPACRMRPAAPRRRRRPARPSRRRGRRRRRHAGWQARRRLRSPSGRTLRCRSCWLRTLAAPCRQMRRGEERRRCRHTCHPRACRSPCGPVTQQSCHRMHT